jgi:hypothetical protein
MHSAHDSRFIDVPVEDEESGGSGNHGGSGELGVRKPQRMPLIVT